MSHGESMSGDMQDLELRIMDLLQSAPDAPEVEVETAKILDAAMENGTLDPQRALELAEQRAKGILMPHLLGRTTFMGLELSFQPGVFVIREETELLGWTAVERLRELGTKTGEPAQKLRVVDLGSGSGNLTCGIAKAVPAAQVWAVDIDPACVDLTRRNVERQELSDRVEVLMGDLFGPLADRGLEGSIDAVVCNPPYIASVRLEKDRAYLLDNEPRAAFDGGPFGINVQLRLIKEALPFLKPGGWLLFEFGLGQENQVKRLVERTGGYDIVDLACNQKGEARVSVNRKPFVD